MISNHCAGRTISGFVINKDMPQVVVMVPQVRRRWRRAGEQLAKIDPERFAKLLEVAERLVKIHEDPLSAREK